MPTYEYVCETCSHHFEQFQSMTAEPIKTCPICKGWVRRLIGAGAGFLFKGSGFYQTDYRSPAYQKKAEAEKKPQTDSGKKSESSQNKTSSTSSTSTSNSK